MASAQTTPSAVCFDHDPSFEGDTDGSDSGPCVANRPPDYAQGSEVRIRVPGWSSPAQTWISVRCTAGCPASDSSSSKVYYARYGGDVVRFPADFVDAGPNNDGGNAVLDRTPRYNSTWEATVHLPTPVQRGFGVWLYDAWEDDSANHTVRPGATHRIFASGFDPNAEVVYRWERRDPNSGRYFPFLSDTVRASAAGVFQTDFKLGKNEAANIASCGALVFDCYRVVVSGAGKNAETVNVQVGPAHIVRSTATTPRQEAADGVVVAQRTQNVTAIVDLYYPSGRLHTGPKFLPDDAPPSVRFGGRALRVSVEKYFPVNATTYLLDDVALRYEPARFVWITQWTVPKDIAIESGAQYRLRLAEQRDLYGNLIRSDTLLNFTLEAAEILPFLVDPVSQLERTREGVFRLAVLYHNGTPFEPSDAIEGQTSPLRGCFVRVPQPAPPPAPPVSAEVPTCSSRPNPEIVSGTYYEGAWNFTKKYPRTYENLEGHRFILVNGTQDRWGNQIWSTASDAFNVVPARPEVEFSTVMRGVETEVLERGSRVFVSATITYHDGSPYNHNVRVDPNSSAAQHLQGTLVRRGPGVGGDPYGPIASEENFTLTETDSTAGRWTATLDLTDDDTFTPVGIWTWRFDVVDNVSGTPNRNVTSFEREVVSSVIQLCPTYQPSRSVPTGTTLTFRFRLFYSDCDIGREVAAGAIETKLQARVFPYDPQRLGPVGQPVSNTIVPAFARDGSNDWGIEYTVPNSLFAGSYIFTVTGTDTFGNKIVPNARSRPFSTFTDIVTRAVITQPRDEVQRGDSATVVFDAREGDTGVDPARPLPRIQLERFDTSSTDCARAALEGGCWARERADVRVPDATLEDHMGVFPVGVDTPVGLYRFSLQGRDRDFHIITGVSGNFTVNPTQVTRALLSTPPERIVKGEPFTFYVESLPGDDLRERVTFLNGRPLMMPQPTLTHERNRLNVTWLVPFEAPTGNYTLRLSGRDVNGNIINVITPPIDALPASLEGRIIGQPPRTIERGEAARLQFGVGYPDGSFYASADEPRVSIVSAAGFSQPATILREGLSFAAVWTPTPESAIGEYYFEVSPQANGATGNLFPPLRSQAFRVVPGAVTRDPVNDLGAEVERLAQAVYTVPFAADDRFVGFELVYYGPSLSTAIDTTSPLPEVTRSPIPHTLDASTGRYVARIVTDHQTQTGTYKVIMTGEDANGNRVASTSRQFIIRPTTIGIVYDPVPSSDKFVEGAAITLSFTATYRVGTIMDPSYGRPSATLLYNGRPATQRPELEYADGKWFMTWTAPAILPPGTYEFAIGGADVMGNPIATARSTPYVIGEVPLAESFMRTVPGPSPILLVALLAAIAAVLARRRRA